MGKMIVLVKKGDGVITWDPKNASETNTAREAFHALRDAGLTPFKIGENNQGEQILNEFDPEAREVIFSPPLNGG